MNLADENCETIEKGTLPFSLKEALEYAGDTPQWKVTGDSISRRFDLGEFFAAMHFVSKVAEIAEQENHHPDIHVSGNMVELVLSTQSIGGLSKNDFILAVKIDRLLGLEEG